MINHKYHKKCRPCHSTTLSWERVFLLSNTILTRELGVPVFHLTEKRTLQRRELVWVPEVFSRARQGASSAAGRHVFGRNRVWKASGTQGKERETAPLISSKDTVNSLWQVKLALCYEVITSHLSEKQKWNFLRKSEADLCFSSCNVIIK